MTENDLVDKLIQKYRNLSCDGKGCYVVDVAEEDLCVSDIPQYIANFESYISRLKEIHWSCDNDKTHILSDDLIDKFKEYQDDLAEDYMGYTGEKFQIGFLKSSCECDKTTLPDVLKSLREDTKQMFNVISQDRGLAGIEHTLKDIMELINQYLYKETQK